MLSDRGKEVEILWNSHYINYMTNSMIFTVLTSTPYFNRETGHSHKEIWGRASSTSITAWAERWRQRAAHSIPGITRSRGQMWWRLVPREWGLWEGFMWKAPWHEKRSTTFSPGATLHQHIFWEWLFNCLIFLSSSFTHGEPMFNKYWFITQTVFLFVFSEQSGLSVRIIKLKGKNNHVFSEK